MTDFEKIYNFQNLYKAHKKSRTGKRYRKSVIDFEINLSENLVNLSDEIKNKTYNISGYYNFKVYDPKEREIAALYYRDRVFLHCLCDEVLAPELDKKLIYDNAACRTGKGTHFAIKRLSSFITDFYKSHGTDGYFLKCDIRKYFDNINHSVLKEMLKKYIDDSDIYEILIRIIDSYSKKEGCGLPLGNQTSQWFALLYLNPMDRLIKEKLRIKYYSRYMDDCVLLHHDKTYLKYCLERMKEIVTDNLGLEFNNKTQIFPIKNGVDYLGWHLYLSDTGKVIRKVRNNTKRKYRKKLKLLKKKYSSGEVDYPYVKQVTSSYYAHLKHGHTYRFRKEELKNFTLQYNKR